MASRKFAPTHYLHLNARLNLCKSNEILLRVSHLQILAYMPTWNILSYRYPFWNTNSPKRKGKRRGKKVGEPIQTVGLAEVSKYWQFSKPWIRLGLPANGFLMKLGGRLIISFSCLFSVNTTGDIRCFFRDLAIASVAKWIPCPKDMK